MTLDILGDDSGQKSVGIHLSPQISLYLGEGFIIQKKEKKTEFLEKYLCKKNCPITHLSLIQRLKQLLMTLLRNEINIYYRSRNVRRVSLRSARLLHKVLKDKNRK